MNADRFDRYAPYLITGVTFVLLIAVLMACVVAP